MFKKSLINASSGTKSITTNGTHDVTNYASASVNVPNPSTGTLTVTSVGTHDVTNYASASVQLHGGGWPISFAVNMRLEYTLEANKDYFIIVDAVFHSSNDGTCVQVISCHRISNLTIVQSISLEDSIGIKYGISNSKFSVGMNAESAILCVFECTTDAGL